MFLKHLSNFGKQFLSKHKGIGGFLNKARSFMSTGMGVLNSAPVKSLLGTISQHAPGVGDVFKDIRKYGNIANNVLNNDAVHRKGERVIRSVPLLSAIDRHSIEKAPRRTQDDDYLGGVSSMFA